MDLKSLRDMPPWEWPENADTLFLKLLTDEQADAEDRLIAAELAGDFTVINEELAGALMALLQRSEANEELRAQAAISLGPILEHADSEGFEEAGEAPDDEMPISEATFRKIQDTLHRLYQDQAVPAEIRRCILEASARAPQDWHTEAVSTAYASDDPDWRLSAVFAMRWVRGFDKQVLESLGSDNEALHFEAICAAGSWELDEAWPHISGLLSAKTDKPLLLAAIDAVAAIRPQETAEVLGELLESDDEEIVEAAAEAMAMAEVWAELEDDDADDEDYDDEDDEGDEDEGDGDEGDEDDEDEGDGDEGDEDQAGDKDR